VGQSSTLSWQVTGATSLSIDQGVGDVSHQSTVLASPTQTTTYTLKATNADGQSMTRQTTISVQSQGTSVGLSVDELSFNSTSGNKPASQTIVLENRGTQPLNWLTQSAAAWLNCVPKNGTLSAGNSASLVISVDVAALAVNDYLSELIFVNVAQPNDFKSLNVKLRVGASQQNPIVQPQVASVKVYPNPWRSDKNPGETIHFEFLAPQSTLKLFTLSGHHVKTLIADTHGNAEWDVSSDHVAAGLYLYLGKDSQNSKARGKFAILR
jgi:hypothetical protein